MLTLAIAKGAMYALSRGTGTDILESIGILPKELELAQGDISWTAQQRPQVVKTLDALTFGTMDVLGLPRFTVPAEFTGAVIVMYTTPINWMVACRWLEGGSKAQDLSNPNGNNGGESAEPATAAQLFSICLQLQNDGIVAECRAAFEKKVNHNLKKILTPK